MLQQLTDTTRGVPFQGGAVTVREKAILPFGSYSWIQNIRNKYPGFKKRKGQIKLHATADGTNEVLNLYEFIKTRVSEQHFYAQMDDGDLLESTHIPPTVAAGVFGTAIHAGSAGQIAASFATILDTLLYSNGVDQHQIYGGTSSYISKLIVWRGSAAPSDIPEEGEDYSVEISDGRSTTVAVLDDLDTYANFECIFIGIPVKAKSITVTVSAANGTASVLSGYYRKTDNTWAAFAGLSDGTDDGGACLGQNGTISWTVPSDWKDNLMFAANMYWIQLRVATQLDAEVEISAVTFDSDFQDIVNIWDGWPVEGIEARVEGSSNYAIYSPTVTDIGGLAAGKKLYLGFTDPIEAIYADPGSTPNDAGVSLSTLKYWNGSVFVSVGSVTDVTSGLAKPGWMSYKRQTDEQPVMHEGTNYYAYWYELIWDTAINADTIVYFTGMPYFDVDELGDSYTCCAWKERACYTFNRWGAYIYVSATGNPQVLNGIDFGILKAGDGRANRVVGMRRFHNELMTWQEEKGVEGGCVTLFEGYSPETFGKLVLSSQVGGMNNKSMEVVDGVITSTRTDEQIKTLAFWISRYGIMASDGRTVQVISDDIQNYFDPKKSESLRRGYEHKHWLKYDSSDNVLRIGLVTGTAATECNVFPIFDLIDKTWSFDTPEQEIGCMTEISAGSGDVEVLQVGGGVDDGLVYLLNSGTKDVDTAIYAYADIEMGMQGAMVALSEFLIRLKAETIGEMSMAILRNGIKEFTIPLSLIPEIPTDEFVRHLFPIDVTSHQITLRIENGNRDDDFSLVDWGVRAYMQPD